MNKGKQINQKEQKKIQLDILSDVADFCENNGLRYFLAYGTLIGAIRHQGYIPWDDDIDIIMPRPDYEKFIDTYKHQEGHYQVYSTKHHPKCFINFAKVHDIRTRFQEEYAVETEYGVFIDIFPLDGYHSHSQLMKCYYASLLLRWKTSVWFKEKPFYKNLIIYLVKHSLFFVSAKDLVGYIEKNSIEKDYETSPLVCFFTEKLQPFKKEIFDHYKYSAFEGKSYRIPENYDELLKIQYGDYMKLPPIEERVNKHYAKAWWK